MSNDKRKRAMPLGRVLLVLEVVAAALLALPMILKRPALTILTRGPRARLRIAEPPRPSRSGNRVIRLARTMVYDTEWRAWAEYCAEQDAMDEAIAELIRSEYRTLQSTDPRRARARAMKLAAASEWDRAPRDTEEEAAAFDTLRAASLLADAANAVDPSAAKQEEAAAESHRAATIREVTRSRTRFVEAPMPSAREVHALVRAPGAPGGAVAAAPRY